MKKIYLALILHAILFSPIARSEDDGFRLSGIFGAKEKLTVLIEFESGSHGYYYLKDKVLNYQIIDISNKWIVLKNDQNSNIQLTLGDGNFYRPDKIQLNNDDGHSQDELKSETQLINSDSRQFIQKLEALKPSQYENDKYGLTNMLAPILNLPENAVIESIEMNKAQSIESSYKTLLKALKGHSSAIINLSGAEIKSIYISLEIH